MSPLAWLNHPWGALWTETLIHFLWQGGGLTALAALALRFPRPSTRYAILLALFSAMTVCPLATFIGLAHLDSKHAHVLVPESSEPSSWGAVALDSDEAGSTPLISAGRSNGEQLKVSTEPFLRLEVGWPQVQPWILGAWLAGVGFCLLRLIVGIWGLSRWMRSARPAGCRWFTIADGLVKRLSGVRGVRLLVSEEVSEPLAFWWWRPVILLPAAWLVEVPPGILESVLAHELAHLRRFDVWVNLFQRLAETLLFYHPGVWWLSARIRFERELCCDELAVSLTGEPIRYARALEFVARQRLETFRPLLATGMGGAEMKLFSRVQRVLGIESPRQGVAGWPWGMAMGVFVFVGGLMTAVMSRSVIGEEPKDPPPGAFLVEEGQAGPPTRPHEEPRDPAPRREPRRGEFGPPAFGPGRGPGLPPGPPQGEGDRFHPRHGEEGDRLGPPPGGELMHDLMHELRALREEVARLREEVRALRGDRGPGGPEREFRGPPRGRGEGGPRPPREGEIGPGRRPEFGPPGGDRRGPPPPPRGEGPEGRGPRDEFRPPREGEREERPPRPPVEEPKKDV